MAVKASAHITLSYIVDVKATYRYYLLQSSTLSMPSKPTTYPPSASWDDSEPSYIEGSTNSLYFTDCTVFNDDTFKYSEVSLSSSYEAAKVAYNKAINAEDVASSAKETADSALNDISNAKTYTHIVMSVDGGNTLSYFNFAGHIEAGTLVNGVETTNSAYVRSADYIKVNSGEDYIWDITNSSGTSVTPTTHFYSESSGNYTYLSSQSTNSITVPSGMNLYLRFAVAINQEDSVNAAFELSLDNLDSIIANDTVDIYAGTLVSLNANMSLNPVDYNWELTDTSLFNNTQDFIKQLNNKLYDETNGDIKKLHTGVEEAKDIANTAKEAVDERQRYVRIVPEDPSISLVTTGDDNNAGTKVKLTSNKISFYNGETEGAHIGYVDSEKADRTSMAVSTTYITEMFPRVEDPNSTEENKWIGGLCWIARTNGHLSLKAVK